MANVAAVYARALYGVAAQSSQLERVISELKEFSDYCSAIPALKRSVSSSLFDAVKRQAIAEEVAVKMKAHEITQRFLGVLSRSNRVSFLSEIVGEVARIRDEEQGSVHGELRSAVAMSNDEVADLAKTIGNLLGRRVELNVATEAALLGGFIANVGGKTFDSSLRTQLHRMKEICAI